MAGREDGGERMVVREDGGERGWQGGRMVGGERWREDRMAGRG